jgi:shikimate dehydrogenase
MTEEALRVSGATRTAGVIGWPVGESLSPVIHNAAFASLGLDWVYVPLPVRPGGLRDALAGLEALGFAAANVTMPHKTESAELIANLSEDAERLAAVNTVVVGKEGLVGHNTDAPGFERFLARDAGFDPAGKRALLYGAGGAARACALALARGGLAELHAVVRDVARADGLSRAVEGSDTVLRLVPFAEAAETLVGPSLLVNATPLGAGGEELPLPPLGADSLVVDLTYRPGPTPLQAAARAAGAPCFDGLGLLLHQAALSFELWTGRAAPFEVMSAAAREAIATG